MLTIVKKNDSYDAITYQLENEDNSTVDLTGASVNFVMGKKNKLITNAKATVTSATSGIVSYQLTPSDTLVSGTFLAEFVVTFANGTTKTYPSNGYITVDVEQNLDTSQANVVVDMIAEKQGDFTSKLNSILLQAGNINMSAMNEYSWTATEGQLVFIFPSSANYSSSAKWFQVSVGNVPVDISLINRSYTNQFALNIDSSNIKAGMTVHAMWVEPIVPVTGGHHTTHEINGSDEINIANLRNYQELVATPISSNTTQLADKASKTDLDATNTNVSANSTAIATKTDKTYVDNLVQSLASGSPKGTYATLTALQTAFPTGNTNIYVITADGNWYYWNGSAWTVGGAYQSTTLADSSVTYDKTAFLTVGTNIFDISTITNGFFLSSGVLTANASYIVSDYIKVIPNTLYSNNNSNHIAFYDAGKNYLSTVNAVTSFTTPANCVYIRIDNNTGIMATSLIMVVQGSTLPSSYVPFNLFFKKNIALGSGVTLQNGIAGSKVIPMSMMYDSIVGKNRLDTTKVTADLRLNELTGSLISSSGYVLTDYIPVTTGEVLRFANLNSAKTQYVYLIGSSTLFVFYDINKSYVSGTDGATLGFVSNTDDTSCKVTVPTNAAYMRISAFGSLSTFISNNPIVGLVSDFPSLVSMFTGYQPYAMQLPSSMIKGLDLTKIGSDWKGKKWVTYGDSITAIGNTNDPTSWAILTTTYHGFNTHLGRGIGSSTFCNSTQIWYANSDGSYNSRDIDYATAPTGTTAHKGYFCSWDRITTMIPQDANLVFVIGGTNDMGANTLPGDYTWVANSNVDTEWAASSYYKGGDFDITKFKGAVASTVMKIQAWVPNAVVVLGSPLSGKTTTSGQFMTSQMVNSVGYTTEDYRNFVQDAAIWMSTPFIDVFGSTGINQLNSPTYIADGTHPYAQNGQNKGNQALSRVVIGGLKNIIPNY